MAGYFSPHTRVRGGLRRRWQYEEGCGSRRAFRWSRRLVLRKPDDPLRDHQRVYDRAEDLQGLAPGPAEAGRYLARVAVVLALLAPSLAYGEPTKPVITRLGWALELDGFVQVDAVPWSQHSFDEIDPNGAPLNETTIMVRRAFLRAIARHDGYFAEAELDANTVKGPATRIVTSQVGWQYPSRGPSEEAVVAVAGGLILVPFGALTPTNARYRAFIDQPAFIRALFPG